MAASKNEAALSFTNMIHADRKKREERERKEALAQAMLGSNQKKKDEKQKFEALAQSILGSGRRPGLADTGHKSFTGTRGNLASRMGVTKRSSSTPPQSVVQDLKQRNMRKLETARQEQALAQAQIVDGRLPDSAPKSAPLHPPSAPASVMSIRGMASTGPFVVMVSNLAPGTTAADIETVMGPEGGEITSCRMISNFPEAVAEITFVERAGAENVIAVYNGREADGRQLHVYWRQTQAAPAFNRTRTDPGNTSQRTANTKPPPAAPRADRDLMDVDSAPPSRTSVWRRPEPTFEDSRYPRDSYERGDSYSRGGRRDYRSNRDVGRLNNDPYRDDTSRYHHDYRP